ncbi:hypothetical protein RXV86_18580 [Alisedimentitalea sp. MJ-SS2]|uniref:hypothetical protein n=1 Tax=Aliisedimentitalea sp. MJ-SS2 TaxID=3049795 RepID=UPI002910AD2D|nr:hypothetical protein [Alisedimentitalea sp. MJ-SS2]MDU8929405.1 hypothetical protein [Alisedimentitalea sp. MJ-SS2]
MGDMTLGATQMKEGVWEALLRRDREEDHADLPRIGVTLGNAEVEGVEVIPDQQGGYVLRVTVPKYAICDGVQTFLITDKVSGEKIGSFTLIAGEALGDDVRAEMDLLRAELDMLKRAFRRHCLETM